MPTPTKGPRLGGSPAHQRIILATLATQLFEHGKITTTEAKAKRLRPLAEKLITKAIRGDLHNRRQVMRTVRDTNVVHVLFTEIAPALQGREGGYTRITKIGPRKGDNAPMAIIEIITEKVSPKPKKTKKADAAPAVEEAAAAEEVEVTADDAAEVVEPKADEATAESAPAEVKAEEEADAKAEKKA